jgi:phosphatidylglycerol:prolipoprotein diacylglycerol transferase
MTVITILVLPYPNIDPVALSLGPFDVKWYGLAYVAGLLLGWQYIKRLLADARLWPGGKAPLAVSDTDDLFIWVALGVVLGGRLGHILLFEPGPFLANPLEIFKIWRGGMAFHGGLIGTIVAMWLFARSRGIVPLTVMDLVAAAVPFGLFFGRIANFINAEVVGAESRVPWAMSFCNDIVRRYNQGQCPYGDVPRHPSQLYEAALEGAAIFFMLRWLTHTKLALHGPGTVGGAFLFLYGGFRFLIEFVKFNEYAPLAGLPISRGAVYSLIMMAIGVLVYRHGLASRATAAP